MRDITVGTSSQGTVFLFIDEEDRSNNHDLSLEEAQYLLGELQIAVDRCRALEDNKEQQ
jgi:hypothetical protein